MSLKSDKIPGENNGKRWRPLTWLLLSLACFVGAFYFWRLGDKWEAQRTVNPPAAGEQTNTAPRAAVPLRTVQSASTAPLAQTGISPDATASTATNAAAGSRLKYRLSNTPRTVGELLSSDQAILLANASIDSSRPLDLGIPASLRSSGDPGAWIVQAHGPIGDFFRAQLRGAGVEIVSYIPNNACLVRANAASQLSSLPGVQAIIPFEPYYKLDSTLLAMAVEQQPLPPGSLLNVVAFPDAREAAMTALRQAGVEIISEERSPFGPLFRVQTGADNLTTLAGLPEIQIISVASSRQAANDLSRARLLVASDTVATTNYLGLTGQNVVVSVNDSGVDATHADLSGRVFGPAINNDTTGHGTHVAATIAGNGSVSSTVSNASGSISPAVTGQYRGMAPSASILAMPTGGGSGDFALQETSGRTNVLISNNSWNYGTFEYDIIAASYDAATRDTLPDISGSQPVLFVFSAGNAGGENANIGTGGNSDTIQSPATSKNSITVGAIEQLRFITNEVHVEFNGGTNISQPWRGPTDSSNQVAGLSSRGNVGVGIEGDFGRFKPDVVAPGMSVISARSHQWDQTNYYNPVVLVGASFRNLLAVTNSLFLDQIAVSPNTVFVRIDVLGTEPPMDLPIYIKHSTYPSLTVFDFIKTNQVSIPPDAALNGQDDSWFYGIGNPTTNQNIFFDLQIVQGITNNVGDYFQVWSNLNESIGPEYRYESGTSMAAANASGVLALMGDFFTNKLALKPSPALMKAMLINGARSVANFYHFQVDNGINYQGWGLINVVNSLPSSLQAGLNPPSAPMYTFEQSATNALATGQRQTYKFDLSSAGRTQPLRVTLAWTDPPGNPVAGVKLVNDLDLIVSNLNNGAVYYGNDILSGNDFNTPWNTNSAPKIDFVNNVENVYLNAPLGSNYSVTVFARRVNANAVTTHPNNVVQDFALVVASGNGLTTNALSFAPPATVFAPVGPEVRALTNAFPAGTGVAGQLVLGQHVGANPPILSAASVPLGTNTTWGAPGSNGSIVLGVANQWHFYTITNDHNFTNAAFITFLPPTLSLPRMGVTNVDHTSEATRAEADIDLFVTRGDPGLLSLNPASVINASKSLKRGGTEVVAFSNAAPGEIFYIGVQSEDQEAAEYGLLGIFSQFPFGSTDTNGNVTLQGVPVPTSIPDAFINIAGKVKPGLGMVFGIAINPITVRRVIVTNNLSHELIGDLVGSITHNQIFSVLNNHTCVTDPSTGLCFTNYTYLYEDNGENDVFGAQHTDGPGSLRDFVGEDGTGVWLLTEVDSLLQHTGRVENLQIRLEPIDPDGTGTLLNIQPNSFGFLAVDVPPEATNMTICVANESNVKLPLRLFIRRFDFPSLTEFDYTMTITALGGCLTISTNDLPPLRPGRYIIGVYNPNAIAQRARVTITLGLSLAPVPTVNFTSFGVTPIIDDAVTYSSILVTNKARIVRAEVGVAIEHPRISDLALTLISPTGKRILLYENRGGPDTADLGSSTRVTNYFGTQTAGDFNANTNVLSPVPTVGTLVIDFDFFPIADTLDVFYDGANIFSSGPTTGPGTFQIPYGPGVSNSITIIMNLGGNPNTNTAWIYTPRVVSQEPSYFLFTENTNTAKLPVKFAFTSPDLGGSVSLGGGFEPPIPATNYIALANIAGWLVDTNQIGAGTNEFGTPLTNQVTVVKDPLTALAPGSQFLALASGVITTNLSVIPGDRYVLNYSFRGPGIADWWRGEGSAADDVGTNSGIASGLVAFPPAMVGRGLQFNGSSFIRVPHNPSLNFTNPFTLEMWYRDDSGAPSYGLIAKRGSGNDPANYGVNFLQDPFGIGFYYNDLAFTSPGNGSDDASVGSPYETSRFPGIPPSGAFHHLAGTYDVAGPGQIRIEIFLDGQLVRTKVMPGNLVDTINTNDVFIGASDLVTPEFMNGVLDEVSIYQRRLSASEIKAIFDAGSAGKFDPTAGEPGGALASTLAKARVSLAGVRTDTIFGDNTNWLTRAVSFTPATNSVQLQVTGLEPGMLLDNFTLLRLPNETVVLPETVLKELVGDNAQGLWRLEIWDNRAGIPLTSPLLLSWQLRFIFDREAPVITPLFNRTPVTNTIPPCQVQFFYVDAPDWVTYITNLLTNATAPVNVWFNQTIPPTGTNVSDILLIGPATNGSTTISIDTTNFPPPLPPLLPGRRYYLSVENPCSNTNVTFTIEVDFGTRFIQLTNMIPYYATNSGATNANDYYFYRVTTNAARAQFEILFPSDRMTLSARLGLPPPDRYSFDYASTNAGFNNELIVVITNSTPVPLTAGDWYLTVINESGAAATYNIMASEWPVTGRPFAITNLTATTNSFCMDWTALPLVHYYVLGVSNLMDTNWLTLTHTLTALTNGADYCVPLPSPFHYFRIVENLALEDVPHPPPAPIATLVTNGTRLDWLGSVTTRYEVQWTPSLAPPQTWNLFTNVATSANGVFTFLDDGTQTGGFGPIRFYRLRQIIVP